MSLWQLSTVILFSFLKTYRKSCRFSLFIHSCTIILKYVGLGFNSQRQHSLVSVLLPPPPARPVLEMSSQPFVQPGEPLNDFLRSFWQRQIDTAEQEMPDYRHPALPLARIKKVMKSDPDVKVSFFFSPKNLVFRRSLKKDLERWSLLMVWKLSLEHSFSK